MAWNPDGRLLAVAYERNSVKVWDAKSKEIVCHRHYLQIEWKCAIPSSKFHSLTWSPDGVELAAASSNTTTLVCNVVLRKVRLTLRGHEEKVVSVAWSPDGTRIVTASRRQNSDRVGRLFGSGNVYSSSPLNSVAWRKDGNSLVTSSEGGRVCIWECVDDDLANSSTLVTQTLSFLNFRF